MRRKQVSGVSGTRTHSSRDVSCLPVARARPFPRPPTTSAAGASRPTSPRLHLRRRPQRLRRARGRRDRVLRRVRRCVREPPRRRRASGCARCHSRVAGSVRGVVTGDPDDATGERVLDLSCGSGEVTDALLRAGVRRNAWTRATRTPARRSEKRHPGKKCFDWSFEDIARGDVADRAGASRCVPSPCTCASRTFCRRW